MPVSLGTGLLAYDVYIMADLKKMHVDGHRKGMPLCDGCTLWREDTHVS